MSDDRAHVLDMIDAARAILRFISGRTQDAVAGRYELAAPRGKATVAVRVTDMLGEEVLVTKTV